MKEIKKDGSKMCLHQIKKTGERCKNRVPSICELYCHLHAYKYSADDKTCVDIEYINPDERLVLMKSLERLNKELDKKRKKSQFMNKEI